MTCLRHRIFRAHPDFATIQQINEGPANNTNSIQRNNDGSYTSTTPTPGGKTTSGTSEPIDDQGVRARAPDVQNWAGFCDSPYNRHLSYYPRGVALLALVDAAAGVQLDRRRGTLVLRPVRAPLRVLFVY